jgi:hypothetical protein
MEKKLVNDIGKPLNTSNNLALKTSYICEWGLNQRKLINIKNMGMWKNEKDNKAYGQNKWKFQMQLAHPLT